jgi:hypothetical protein
MPITLIRVINQQTINRSILLDKLDDGQSNTEGYANLPKQQVYVPYSNPANVAVKGYVDLVPTDRVLLSADRGTIAGLKSAGRTDHFAFNSALISTPTVSAVSNLGTDTTIDGTTFLSVTPDVTYVKFTNTLGASQFVPSSAFSVFNATQIVVPDAAVSIGTPGEGWTVAVVANSKTSNLMPIGNVAVITTAVLLAGDVTITGVDFLSTSPLTSSVVFTGTGAVTLTQAAITGGGGTFNNTTIVIPTALIPGVVEGTTSVAVTAEGFTSAAKALIVTPVLTIARLNMPTLGDITITGTSLLSNVGDSSVAFSSPLNLTQTDITGAGGTFNNTTIVIPAALAAGAVSESDSVVVTADSLASSLIYVLAVPMIASALIDTPLAGDLTISGTGFSSVVPTNTSVTITGTGAIVLTQATIVGGAGTVNDTTIVIPAALFTSGPIAAATSSAQITADFLNSDVVAVA